MLLRQSPWRKLLRKAIRTGIRIWPDIFSDGKLPRRKMLIILLSRFVCKLKEIPLFYEYSNMLTNLDENLFQVHKNWQINWVLNVLKKNVKFVLTEHF